MLCYVISSTVAPLCLGGPGMLRWFRFGWYLLVTGLNPSTSITF